MLANDDAIQQEIIYSDMVQREDEEVCEQVQVGLQLRAYEQGRYSVKREECVYHFHCLWRLRPEGIGHNTIESSLAKDGFASGHSPTYMEFTDSLTPAW